MRIAKIVSVLLLILFPALSGLFGQNWAPVLQGNSHFFADTTAYSAGDGYPGYLLTPLNFQTQGNISSGDFANILRSAFGFGQTFVKSPNRLLDGWSLVQGSELRFHTDSGDTLRFYLNHGGSWPLIDGQSSVEAEILRKETQTVFGQQDSVIVYQIVQGPGIEYEIHLSKNHGLLKMIDLYDVLNSIDAEKEFSLIFPPRPTLQLSDLFPFEVEDQRLELHTFSSFQNSTSGPVKKYTLKTKTLNSDSLLLEWEVLSADDEISISNVPVQETITEKIPLDFFSMLAGAGPATSTRNEPSALFFSRSQYISVDGIISIFSDKITPVNSDTFEIAYNPNTLLVWQEGLGMKYLYNYDNNSNAAISTECITLNGIQQGKDCSYHGFFDPFPFPKPVTVYPNPTNGGIALHYDPETHDLEGSTFQIIDVQGKIVMNGIVPGPYTSINTTELESGVYYFRVLDQEDVWDKFLMY